MGLSKSKYTMFCQCEKALWLDCYKKELATIEDTTLEILNKGNTVGDLAMGLLGDYVEVTVYDGDKLDLNEMVRRTKEEILKGTINICEASFYYLDNYCAVDILHKYGDGYSLYEVKSTTKVEDYHIKDVSYQRYVLEKNNLKINNCYIVHINPFYVRHGDLKIKSLFQIEDVTDLVNKEIKNVEINIERAREVLASSSVVEVKISENCLTPFKCPFYDYCHKDILHNSIFSMYRMSKKKMYDYYHKGIITFEDIKNSKIKLNDTQKRQINFELENKDIEVDKTKLNEFLQDLKYPLYFLDFETMQEAIPLFDNSRPYSQIPFQYSLHILDEKGNLTHKEFLAKEGRDPRLEIAAALCRDIPKSSTIIAYNKAFECTRLKELALLFPNLGEHLLDIEAHIVDLLIPFQKGYVYKREMEGSFSIKKVLPAFFKDESLDYHALPGAQNGKEAMQIYANLVNMSEEEKNKARFGLLEYCKLDTLAMVKLFMSLKELV